MPGVAVPPFGDASLAGVARSNAHLIRVHPHRRQSVRAPDFCPKQQRPNVSMVVDFSFQIMETKDVVDNWSVCLTWQWKVRNFILLKCIYYRFIPPEDRI